MDDWLEMADIERKRERETIVNHNLHDRQSMKLASWLKDNGYLSLTSWGLDSDFTCENGVWFNEDGNEIDIFYAAWYAMEASQGM